MSWLRTLGDTGLTVSALGLGTVKLGRDRGVRYPTAFQIPDDKAALRLLDTARHCGINLIDTAPAYGDSEERLGRLLHGQRQHWVICSKVGEEFDGAQSRFDFSPRHTRHSIQRSLQRLRVEALDIALIHSDGSDLTILQDMGTLQTLRDLQREGLVRAVGISSKTTEGGLAAAPLCDVLMVSYNLEDQSQQAVLDACRQRGVGVMIKKALAGGHAVNSGGTASALSQAMALCLGEPATSSVVIGTVNTQHLTTNVRIAREILG